MSEEISGSLYYIIPAEVMHDENLSISEKMIYALISGLANKHGYCFASNEWLEKTLKIQEKQIQRYLKNLEDIGYITRKIHSDEKNPFKKQRHIYINTSFKKCLPGVKYDGSGSVGCDGSVPSDMTGILSEEKNLISKDTHSGASSSAEASGVCENFIEKIKEINPSFKEPKNDKWEREFDCILKEDKRDLADLYAMIKWIFAHPFWKSRCLCPTNLRKNYDTIYLQMVSNKGDEEAEHNRLYCREIKKRFPDKTKDLIIRPMYAMNGKTGKDVSFNLPRETFRAAFLGMFGGQYIPPGEKHEQSRQHREHSEMEHSQ